MTDAPASDDAPGAAPTDGGVLAKLPRTRPQRASPRRAAARVNGRATLVETETEPTKRDAGGGRPSPVADSAASTRAKSVGAPPRPSDAVRARRARTSKRARSSSKAPPAGEPAPRQGYECEGEGEDPNRPIAPPGGAELVASAAELFGELAKAGLSAGERLFKDVFSRLRHG